jgi:hypothetical protein
MSCHTGRAFCEDTLLQTSDENVDAKLWQALRGMDERALLIERRLASASTEDPLVAPVESYRREAAGLRNSAALVRALLRNEDAEPGVAVRVRCDVTAQAASARPRVSTMLSRATSAANSGTTPSQKRIRTIAALEPPAAAESAPTTNGPPAANTRPML